MDENVKVGMNHAMEAGMNVHIKAGMTLILEAGLQISLKVGPSFIDIGPAGISIMGTPLCNINGGGAAGSGAGAKPKSPKKPKVPSKGDVKKAAPTKPEQADDSKTGHKSCP
jgi:type VI secretion system secreted protein VgrG